MNILVINPGSSSLKFSIFGTDGGERGGDAPQSLYDGEISGIGEAKAELTVRGAGDGDHEPRQVQAATPEDAMGLVLEALRAPGMPPVEAVGYRVVHPGAKLRDHQRITDEVLRELEGAVEFAPLHDPVAIAVIRTGMARFPRVEHYACFDTIFHQTMQEEATTYPIPEEFRAVGVRRYGFHGLSCESVVRQLARACAAHRAELPKRLVIAHLGSGCSVTAVVDGKSVDTSMGLTPTGGVVMGTRPGDLDPGLLLYLLRQQKDGDAAASLEKMLNHSCGMVALSGMENDVRAMRKAAGTGDAAAALALRVFTRSITKAMGGFCWAMGGTDAVAFAGGIGEHDAATRAEILGGLEGSGLVLDRARNEGKGEGVRRISADGSATAVFIVPAEEDRMIAWHVQRMAKGQNTRASS